MPDYVVERVMRKRGRLRVFEHFAPARTALVIIDMQRFYLADCPPALEIIPTVNRLARGFRAAGAHVAWVSMTAGRNGESLWPLYHEYFFRKENGDRHRDQLSEGCEGHRLHADLDTRPDDIYASKNRFSAFLPQACDLHGKLQAAGIENVAIGGTVTNFCCETSARDAMMMDYRVAMISDACAARHPEDHRAGFTTVFQSFGDVMTADEMLGGVLHA
ncbi:MAG TPA: isochorismatase family cysteine hydrolase [Nevskiaceae bacterium]